MKGQCKVKKMILKQIGEYIMTNIKHLHPIYNINRTLVERNMNAFAIYFSNVLVIQLHLKTFPFRRASIKITLETSLPTYYYRRADVTYQQ